MAKRELEITLNCYHADCAGDPTTLIVDLGERISGSGTKDVVRYCKRNHANIITVPDGWDDNPVVLDDLGFGSRSRRPPVVDGRKP